MKQAGRNIDFLIGTKVTKQKSKTNAFSESSGRILDHKHNAAVRK
jgi:hypothetical protein